MFGWFTKKDDAPRWSVTEADITPLGVDADGLHAYAVVWHKGAMSMTGTYRFPTAKPIAKVLALAKAEC